MRIAWALLFTGVLATTTSPAVRAAAWGDVFAADTDRFVFFGEDGSLLRAPFNLASRETLWSPRGSQHLVRVRVSPDGERVAWLTRGDDTDTTRLWVDVPGGSRLRMRYFALLPQKYGRVHSEPEVPTTEDADARGARLVQPGAFMRRFASNTLEWTPDSRAVVFGYNDGIAAVSVDGGAGFSVCKALAVHLDPLAPAPIYLVDAIVLRNSLHYFDPLRGGELATDQLGTYEQEGDLLNDQPVGAMDLAHPDVMISKVASAGTYLLYPMAHRWRVFTASDLSRARLRAASPGAVWWASGPTVHAIRTADPKATVEGQAGGNVVWLGYDEPHGSVAWAGGRAVQRRAEDGGPVGLVLSTGSPIRAGLTARGSGLVGLVTSDSLVVWDMKTDTVRRVALEGQKPQALYLGPGGEILTSSDAGRGSPPSLARADFSGGRLVSIDTPPLKGGMFRSAGHGSWILLYDPAQKPPGTLQTYDVRGGRWTAVENPGLSGWEPLVAD